MKISSFSKRHVHRMKKTDVANIYLLCSEKTACIINTVRRL